MQREFERDYQNFLLNLIPRHLLSSGRLEGVVNALASGDRNRMIREAYLSMEELSDGGVFIKNGFMESGGIVRLDYEGLKEQVQFTLEMKSSEWKNLPAEKLRKEQEEIVPGVLTGIISALSLNSSRSISNKISSILLLPAKVKADFKGFLILDSKLNVPDIYGVKNVHEENIENIKKNKLYEKVLRNRNIVIVSDTFGIKKSFFELDKNVKRLILIPLISSGRNVGVLEIHCSDKEKIDKNALFNLSLVGEGIVRFLRNNIQLEQMVSIDKLTNVNNRNYYETQVPLELERASREKKFLGFLIMDIDHFKKFNDEYGHDTGDEVLKLVAQTIKKHLRKIDLFIRFGGEEFIAVLPGASKEATMRTAERLRSVIENTEYRYNDGKTLKITISIGGSIFPVDAKNQMELFRNADKSLLEAKRSGRNKIVFF